MDNRNASAADGWERMENKMEMQEIIVLVKETKAFVDNRERARHVKVKGLADYDRTHTGFLTP